MVRKFVLLGILLLSAGCGAVLNPYSSKFQCPPTDLGKCVGLRTAYEESLNFAPEERLSANATSANAAAQPGPSAEDLYLKEKYETLRALIREPRAPVVKPPKVMRVLILSYVGDSNVLYGWRYVYFFADEPQWIIETGGELKE